MDQAQKQSDHIFQDRETSPLMVVGNWKMNCSLSDVELFQEFFSCRTFDPASVEVTLCLPHPFLIAGRTLASKAGIQLGAQTCFVEPKGAYTGDVSAKMIAECGARYVIVGHSERRLYHNESHNEVQKQIGLVLDSNLEPIICCGEVEREAPLNKRIEFLTQSLSQRIPENYSLQRLIIAYEPEWAIGSGEIPKTEEIEAVCAGISEWARGVWPMIECLVLYGGSVNSQNAPEILKLPSVSGVLVGGASNEPSAFAEIISSSEGIGRTP